MGFLKGQPWVRSCFSYIFSLKVATANHFADDTCIIYQSKKLKALESDLNHDQKLCGEWLNANRLSLNVDKTTFTISFK